MAQFDANKVMWSSNELIVGSAADKVFEAVATFLKEHSPFVLKDVPYLLLAVGKEYDAIFKVVKFVFAPGQNYRYVADRMKDLLTMLERDNDWLDNKVPK